MPSSADLRLPRSQGPQTASEDRAARPIWVAFAVLGAALAGYLALLVVHETQDRALWSNDRLVVGFELIASLLCIAGGRLRPGLRTPAFVMGLACLCWTAGDVASTLDHIGVAAAAPPSARDALHLAFFPLALLAVVLFTRREVRRGATPNWLDGAIAAFGMAALCSGFALRGLEHLVDGPSLALATHLAYPVGDLLLLGLATGSAVVVSGSSRSTLVLITIGAAVNAAGDTFNLVGYSTDLTQVGMVINAIAWPASILVIAMSMCVLDRDDDPLALPSVSGFVVPGFVTCSSLAILAIDTVHPFGVLAVGLATVTVVLAGLRLAFRPALRRAREQARSSERRYRMLFEQNPQPILAYDRRTLAIVAFSDALVARYGYTREALQTMTVTDLLPAEDVQALRAYLATHPDGERPEDAGSGYPGRHRLADGTIIEVEVTSNNLELDGRDCRVALYHDVTARNQAAAQLAIARDRAVEASNMKSAFLANMSHEIRTPMNGVIGMNDLLLATPLNEEQLDYAREVSRSGAHMLSLINDILDISKLESGHVEVDHSDFDIHDSVEQACSALTRECEEKGLRFDLEIDENVPRLVRGDGRRTQQVLLNLISNAVKFTRTGGVHVRVSSERYRSPHAVVRFEVTDTGIGVDPQNLPRMFDPFTQADVSTTRNYGGTGLGLAIARELVELMGGAIGAQSEPGRGSTFWFELELVDADSAELFPARTGWAAAGETPVRAEPAIVLVVEDSPINQIVAVRALERCGCRAKVANNGIEALEALAAQHYDAVLMDCQMPEMDGYEATAELRRREGNGRHIPVIAMTANAMEGDRERCFAAGMDDYVSKPMRPSDLAQTLARWISAPVDGDERHTDVA